MAVQNRLATIYVGFGRVRCARSLAVQGATGVWYLASLSVGMSQGGRCVHFLDTTNDQIYKTKFLYFSNHLTFLRWIFQKGESCNLFSPLNYLGIDEILDSRYQLFIYQSLISLFFLKFLFFQIFLNLAKNWLNSRFFDKIKFFQFNKITLREFWLHWKILVLTKKFLISPNF